MDDIKLIHEVKKLKGVKTANPQRSRMTFSLSGSLQYTDHYFFMESPNDKPFVGGESRLDYLFIHVHHGM